MDSDSLIIFSSTCSNIYIWKIWSNPWPVAWLKELQINIYLNISDFSYSQIAFITHSGGDNFFALFTPNHFVHKTVGFPEWVKISTYKSGSYAISERILSATIPRSEWCVCVLCRLFTYGKLDSTEFGPLVDPWRFLEEMFYSFLAISKRFLSVRKSRNAPYIEAMYTNYPVLPRFCYRQ